MKNHIKTFKKFNLCLDLLIFALLLSGLLFFSCGKKGPPEMIKNVQEKLRPVENIRYQIQDNNILLKWESNYKQTIEGFEIFMAKQDIKKCQGCPVVFIKIDFLSSDANQYQKELKKGYRYFFKIITSGAKDIKSIDSETIKIEFE
ncbi:MAG: hypothetical protein KAI40_09615 [Desulfobacterales bacterium]|nr:hypothetical protein [Desulfobacterales bacterium]